MFLDSVHIDHPEHWLVSWNLDGQAYKDLRVYADEVTYPSGAVIFSEGDPSDGMYLVLKGMVIVTLLDAHGQEQILRVINENQSFGELGLLVGTSRHATVKAGPKVRLLRLAPEQLNRLEREKPELSSQVYKVLARTLAEQWMRGGVWVGRAPATR